MFYLPESDPAAVYSAVKTAEDVCYGQIVIKSNRKRGKAALLCVHHLKHSLWCLVEHELPGETESMICSLLSADSPTMQGL